MSDGTHKPQKDSVQDQTQEDSEVTSEETSNRSWQRQLELRELTKLKRGRNSE